MRKQKGFSLIELLIVVAIILIIAAIAIPNLLRSRIAANESSAVGSIRTVNTAQVTYSSTYPNVGFANAMTALGGLPAACAVGATSTAACLIDQVLAAAPSQKSGYTFAIGGLSGAVPEVTYSVGGDPIQRGQTGQRSFFSDQSGVIRFNTGAPATSGDPPLQ